MEVEIRGFKGCIFEMDSNVITKVSWEEPKVVSYNVTLYIANRKATIKLKKVRPEEIKVLNIEEEEEL